MAAIKFLVKSRELSKNEAVQLYKEAVVEIKTGQSSGTGFNILADGYIITNHHVVNKGSMLRVGFPEGKSYSAQIVMNRPDIDIAILKVDDPQHGEAAYDFPTLELKFEHIVEQEEPVYVIGNPLLFRFIANEGQIIGTIQLQDWEHPVLVIDAPIYKGNSGSPVIAMDGKVIGVVFATTRIEHNGSKKKVGLAIPVDYMQEQLES